MLQSSHGKHGATHPAKKPAPPAAASARNAQLPPLSIYALNEQQQGLCRDHVSAELVNACGYAVKGPLPFSDEAVEAWLRQQAPLIIAAETKWNVDRRAIAGVIAWETLVNVLKASNWLQWGRQHLLWQGIGYGPGKVHADGSAVDAEQAGYLPQVSESARRSTVATIQGGITYVAAIMRGFADLLTCRGKYSASLTYWNPDVLTFCYHGWHFDDIRSRFGDGPNQLNFDNHKRFDTAEKDFVAKRGLPAMPPWVMKNITFLEAAVGRPSNESLGANVTKLPNFRCEFNDPTKPCAQRGCPHRHAK